MLVVLSEIHLAFFPQEVGVGFKKASEPELAARRCALPSSITYHSRLNLAILFQSKSVA